MNWSFLNPFRKSQPLGMSAAGERQPTEAELGLLREIQARLSGLGEPPQFGSGITLAGIQKAIRMSELGEPWLMFALFRDMIQNDTHLQAEIGKRIMSFMGQNETIEPVDPKNPDDIQAAEFIEDIIANCENWREGSVHLAQGHVWPISGAEKIYAKVEAADGMVFRHPTTWRLKMLHPIPWPLFTYKVAYWNAGQFSDSHGNSTGSGAIPINNPAGIVAYQPTQGTGDQEGVLVWNPQDWHADLRFYGTLGNGMVDYSLSTGYKPDKTRHVLHSAQVATSGMRDNFGATLRSLIPIWFYKKNLLDWYMQKMERYGGPFAVGYANMSNKGVSDILTKAFNQASVLNALLVPPGTRIDLKEVNTSGMSDGFAKGIEVLNTEMTKAILGQTLSTSSKGSGMMGGSGVADLHGEVKEEWSLFDKRTYCDMQGQQIFVPILRLNGYRGRCRSVRGGVSANQQALLAKTLQSLYLSGVRVKKEEEQKLTNTFGFKMEVFDPQAEAAAAAKNDKSTRDRQNN